MAWDVQVHGAPGQNRQGWTKDQGQGQWSSCTQMTVPEISLRSVGNGSAQGPQRCTGRSVSWGGERAQQHKEGWEKKKRKMCGSHHSERIREMSFIVTHSRVISDWRGTDGLEEKPLSGRTGKSPAGFCPQGCEGSPDTARGGLWSLQTAGHGAWGGPQVTETPGRDGDSSSSWGQKHCVSLGK